VFDDLACLTHSPESKLAGSRGTTASRGME